MLTPGTRAVLGAATAALIAFACCIACEWGGPAVTEGVCDIGSPLFALLALTCAVVAAVRTTSRLRLAWCVFSFGLVCWVAGDLVSLLTRSTGQPAPLNGFAIDALYLAFPVVTSIAWSVNGARERRPMAMRPLLDGLIVASALFLILWALVLDPLFTAYPDDRTQLSIVLVRPIADVVMVTVSIVVTASVPFAYRSSLVIITAALIVIAVTDGAFLYIRAFGGLTDLLLPIGWAAGMVLIAAGALIGLRTPHLDGPVGFTPRPLIWLPYVPMPFTIVFAVQSLWRGGTNPHPVLVAGVFLVCVAFVRQLVVLLDNRGLQETVANQALRDPLTGLANRPLFADRLDHAMQMRDRSGRDVSVLSLDLDDFKMVNDTFGHPAGDELLRSVSHRLVAVVPAGDTIARLGGDEFAIVIEDGPESAGQLAQCVVEVFDKPFILDGQELYIHPSVGMATAPPLDVERITADDLFKRADLAMHSAKRAGVGGVHNFSAEMRLVDRAEVRTPLFDSGARRHVPLAGIQLLGQLRRAIDDGDLVLYYQPKISLSSSDIVGVEALIRWPHAEFGLLTPNQFLPLVRQNGLMDAVTDLVLAHAVADTATWYDARACDLPVAINLFAPSLNDLALPDRILTALGGVGLPPTALSVEITEHLLVANIRRAGTVIDRLRANGLRTAIDDFGSGYATMSYLRDLAVDEVKLDRQFIAPILRSERTAAIVQSVIDLAHALGINCVAEGVEDKATADRLRHYRCDVAQGHYFARPMAAEALRDRISPASTGRPFFPSPTGGP